MVGGRIGPVFVLKSTRIEYAVETNIDTRTNRTHIIYNEKKITYQRPFHFTYKFMIFLSGACLLSIDILFIVRVFLLL